MNRFVGITFIGIVLFLTVVLGLLSITSIRPGYAGVVYNRNGGIEPGTLGQGWHFVAPWKKVIAYPVSTETVFLSKSSEEGKKSDNSLWVNTKDGKMVNVDVTFAYHMDIVKLPYIFTKFRGSDADAIEWGFMKNELYRAINNVTSQYSMMEMVGEKRPEINTKVFNSFREALQDDGIIIETCNLSRVEPDKETLAAIQAVVNEQNKLKQAEIEKQKAQIEAEKRRIEAQGLADAALIQAEGQAKANEKLQQSLTPEIVQMEWIKKWDGKLPATQLGNNAMPVFNAR